MCALDFTDEDLDFVLKNFDTNSKLTINNKYL